jgi:serine phosphatase RsbU (regulator of sigma subunit)
MAWGIADFIWFAVQLTGTPLPGIPNLFLPWGTTLLGARGFAVAGLLTALLALLFREQRQVTEERAILAGEMQAAGDIQRMLAPSTLETAPGLRIEVAFRPMREVGGDFYQCRVLPDGRQRLLIGDVSGKGTGAAMAAALILGGAAARDSDSPAELLAHLNRVLRDSQVGGFATCLCADVAADGSVQFANAGHLSPYCRNQEIAVQPGLPLGLTLEARYEQITFELAPGAMLTFLSDGVVEARDSAGSLFGFERTQALSSQPASAIADAAQKFGQEDDITVLTLSRLPAVVEAKTEPGSAAFAQA